MSKENAKKKNNKLRWYRVALIVCLVFIVMLGGIIFYTLYEHSTARSIVGTWTYSVNFSDNARAEASRWLASAAGGADVDITQYIGEYSIPVTLTIKSDGGWSQVVDGIRYQEACSGAAQGLERAAEDLIAARIREAGHEEMTVEEVASLVYESIGMTLGDYLRDYGPALYTAEADFRSSYEGSGNYRLSGDVLLREGQPALKVLVDDHALMLYGEEVEPVIYDRISPPPASLFGWTDISAVHAESHRVVENMPMSVDGGAPVLVKILHFAYHNNRYISLRDLAAALNGTEKQFSLILSGDEITITTGETYTPAGGENTEFVRSETDENDYQYTTQNLRINPITIDGRGVKYNSFIGDNAAGVSDCFMSITDAAMMLDLDMTLEEDQISLHSAGSFTLDLETLAEQGFYYEVYSAIVGDASTGEVYASYEPELSVPIASTTKLMTYLCVMDAITDGRIYMNDTVIVPPEAEALSKTADGVIAMTAGQETNITDLLMGMLLPSSNECALTLAVHVSGSEEAFVERMNAMASVIGLSDATVFYNCNGLPVFTDSVAASKIQNHMSAQDMFTLVSYILRYYPEIKEITSLATAELTTLNRTVKNTNPLLYNVPGVVGLKTGTTTMSGACLVSALDVTDAEGNIHTIVAAEFGAEDSVTRTTFSEELIRYGRQVFQNGGSVGSLLESEEIAIPTELEGLIQMLLLRL